MFDALATGVGRQIIAAGKQLYDGGKEDGTREEREAVVQHLRAFAAISRRAGNTVSEGVAYGLAETIEAGEHRKP